MNKPFKVVLVPTMWGIAHGFKREVLSEHDTQESADEAAYLNWMDEPAPDKADYYQVRVEVCDECMEL